MRLRKVDERFQVSGVRISAENHCNVQNVKSVTVPINTGGHGGPPYFMKFRILASIKVIGGWEWLLATIMGICQTELIAVKNCSHNQNRLN